MPLTIAFTKRRLVVLALLLLIFGGTLAWYAVRAMLAQHFLAHFQRPPAVVSTTRVRAETWHPALNAVGTVQAIDGVEISSEVQGQVIRIDFQSGQFVKKGASLLQLNDAVYRQTLKDDLAQLKLATLAYQRQKRLFPTGATPASLLDKAQAELAQAEAQSEASRVLLDQKNIKAPFDGKLGIRKVNIGQYITPGQPLVLLQSLDPMYVNFDLPEQHLKDVQIGQTVLITTDLRPGTPISGKVTAIDATIDVDTRSITLQATVPNADRHLYPGLFANVALQLPQQEQVLTVPQTAVTYTLYGDYIYVVKREKDQQGKPMLLAEQHFVTLGDRRGTVVAVEKGLQLNDEVVTAGQLKLTRSRSPIKINNAVQLNAQ